MSNNIFQIQIVILGIIDYLSDILENDINRKEVKDNLLAAIQATFTNKLLENNETSQIFKEIMANIPNNQDYVITLENMQKSLSEKQMNIDMSPILKESAKEVLSDFVAKSGRSELTEQINGVLQ